MLLFVLLSCLALTAAQKSTTISNVEKAAEKLKELAKPSTLDLKKAFRCGLFFPNPRGEKTLKPISALLIFNATWPATECPSVETDRYNTFCDNLFSKFTTSLSLSDPSLEKERRIKGDSIGDDVCGFLKLKAKSPYVGVPKSRKFPAGLDIAMFSNACGKNEPWIMTGLKHREKVCCRNGRYRPCKKLGDKKTLK